MKNKKKKKKKKKCMAMQATGLEQPKAPKRPKLAICKPMPGGPASTNFLLCSFVTGRPRCPSAVNKRPTAFTILFGENTGLFARISCEDYRAHSPWFAV